LSVHGIMTLNIHLENNFMALSKKTGLENYLVRLNEKTRITIYPKPALFNIDSI
jgi:hypothetical protein